MKKLQVMIEDKLMHDLKMYALNNDTTLKDIITEAATKYLYRTIAEPTPTPKSKQTPKPKKEKPTETPKPKKKPEPTPEPEQIIEEPLPEGEYYLLRKPVYEGKREERHTRKTNLTVEWWLEEGDSQYYDEYQTIIPFRYKKADGTDHVPDAYELAIMEKEYEKPIVVEK